MKAKTVVVRAKAVMGHRGYLVMSIGGASTAEVPWVGDELILMPGEEVEVEFRVTRSPERQRVLKMAEWLGLVDALQDDWWHVELENVCASARNWATYADVAADVRYLAGVTYHAFGLAEAEVFLCACWHALGGQFDEADQLMAAFFDCRCAAMLWGHPLLAQRFS